ncbi:MAG: di-heme oxidoredictase family protein, partial [Gelidibacter sp.]
HGGEAENSKNKYIALTQTEKDQVLKFIESL